MTVWYLLQATLEIYVRQCIPKNMKKENSIKINEHYFKAPSC